MYAQSSQQEVHCCNSKNGIEEASEIKRVQLTTYVLIVLTTSVYVFEQCMRTYVHIYISKCTSSSTN